MAEMWRYWRCKFFLDTSESVFPFGVFHVIFSRDKNEYPTSAGQGDRTSEPKAAAQGRPEGKQRLGRKNSGRPHPTLFSHFCSKTICYYQGSGVYDLKYAKYALKIAMYDHRMQNMT